MIVCAVLNIFAVRTDLCAKRLIEPRPTQLAPSRLIERNTSGIKRGGLSDEMIVVLRTRIDQRWRNARGVMRDACYKLLVAFLVSVLAKTFAHQTSAISRIATSCPFIQCGPKYGGLPSVNVSKYFQKASTYFSS